jgi:hypothetical protein
VVADMLQLNPLLVYALINPSATYSFIVSKIIGKLGGKFSKVEKEFTIDIPLG